MSSLIVEVCVVNNVINHPNGDRLDIVEVKGWSCITGRDQFKIGDKIVYIPPDSIIPDSMIDEYQLEYIRGNNRLRTIKLRGCISQGLVIPSKPEWKLGQDVAKELGITKYEPPKAKYEIQAPNSQKKKNNPNPLFDKYTSIENIKNYNNVFQENDMVVITEKIHGTNWRAGRVPRIETGLWSKFKASIAKLFGKYDGYDFVYGSHNVQLSYTGERGWYETNVYAKIAERYKIKDIIPNGYVVYGEIYGKGIQDLTYGLDDIDLVVFDVKKDGKYLSHPEFISFCARYSLPIVPLLYVGKWKPEILDQFTYGNSLLSPVKQIREGCIVKSYDEVNDIRIGRKILKSISPDYLMRNNGTEFH